MNNESRFRPIYPPGKRKPDPKVIFRPKDPIKAQEREAAIAERPPFVAKPPTAPEKCPLCGTLADDYRQEHEGEELLLPGGNPFICAVCGNKEWSN